MNDGNTIQQPAKPATTPQVIPQPPASAPVPPPAKKRPWLFVVIGLGTVVLLATGASWWLRGGKSSAQERKAARPLAADSRFLPDGARIVTAVKVDQFLNSAAGKALVTQLAGSGQQAGNSFDQVGAQLGGKRIPPAPAPLGPSEFFAQQVRREIGIDPSDILHLTFARNDQDSHPVFVFRTRKTYKAEDIQAQLPNKTFRFVGKPTPPRTFHSLKVGAHTIHEGRYFSFILPEDGTVVYGMPESLRAILERNGDARWFPELKEAIALADFSKTICVAEIWPSDTSRADGPAILQLLGPVALPTWDTFAIDVADRFQITYQGRFLDAGAAGNFKTALDRVVANARQDQGVPLALTRLAKTIQAAQSGNQLSITASAESEGVMELIELLGRHANKTFKQVGTKIVVPPALPKPSALPKSKPVLPQRIEGPRR